MPVTTAPTNPRPGRLPALGIAAIVLLLGAAFFSGLAVWWGQTIQSEQMTAPTWLHPVLVLHGCLFPVQCILFGILLAHHIRMGWQLRANLLSGFVMEAVFFGLIATGAGLYYAGSEEWRERLIWAHRLFGLALPLTLGIHWFMGLRWARQTAA